MFSPQIFKWQAALVRYYPMYDFAGGGVQTETDKKWWSKTRAFDPAWGKRANRSVRFAAQYFLRDKQRQTVWKSGVTVLELGCGPYMPVKQFLPPGATHIPGDIVRRDNETYVVDLNLRDDQEGKPNSHGDIPQSLETLRHKMPADLNLMTLLGVLEYVEDLPRVLKVLHRFNIPILITYNSLEDRPSVKDREKLLWVNHLRRTQLTKIIAREGFECERKLEIRVWLLIPNSNGQRGKPCKDIQVDV